MDPITILSVFGAASAAGGLITTLRALQLKLRSKNKFIATLRSHRSNLDRAGKLLDKIKIYDFNDNVEIRMSKEELEGEMRTIIRLLPSPDQKRVSEGLFQPSERGRIGYIQSVISAANSDVQSPIGAS